jgi:hypothetical protein
MYLVLQVTDDFVQDFDSDHVIEIEVDEGSPMTLKLTNGIIRVSDLRKHCFGLQFVTYFLTKRSFLRAHQETQQRQRQMWLCSTTSEVLSKLMDFKSQA